MLILIFILLASTGAMTADLFSVTTILHDAPSARVVLGSI
jgi:hypothetical protein